jgi:serine/threonine protein kinase
VSTAPFLSRQFGDYLLVAQLSEDALGPVFRALYAADERRFVRLRILRSEELLAEPIENAIRESVSRGGSLTHAAIVDRPQLDIVENLPFLTWDETSGWTLDTLLSRVRAFGIRIPVEYALLIAERIAAALEHAHRTVLDGRPTSHGLLWPAFVSISHDAAVRVGGFGLAQGVLPSLSQPRLTAEIAPYVAPEIRVGSPINESGDVYALGAILAELLTGRRPSLDSQALELRAGDPRSEELEAFLHRCLATPDRRFSSAVDAHRELQRMVTGNPFSLYTANLALFLYKLLNPESQLAAPRSDWESTNPVTLNAHATVPPRATAPESVAVVDPSVVGVAEPVIPTAGPPVEASELIAQTEPIADPELASHAAELLVDAAETAVVFAPDSDALPADGTAGADIAAADVGEQSALPFPPERLPRPLRVWATAWTRPAVALAAAAGLTVGAFLIIGQFRGEGHASAERPRSAAGLLPLVPISGGSQPVASAPRAPEISVAGAAAMPVALTGSTGRFEAAAARPASPVRPSKPVQTQSRQPAEDLRLRAALARIDADRVNARETAGEIFGEGRHSEEEGERLLRQRDYEAAQLAFSRAARLFHEAQEISWEERLRQANLSSEQ